MSHSTQLLHFQFGPCRARGRRPSGQARAVGSSPVETGGLIEPMQLAADT